MMTICQASPNGLHKLEWRSTGDGGGYWACVLPSCEHVEHESTGHHGGYIVLDTLFAVILGFILIGGVVLAAYRDRHMYDHIGEPYTKEASHAHQ